MGTLSVRASNLENVKITVDENALQYVNKENLLTQDEKTVSSTVTLGKKMIHKKMEIMQMVIMEEIQMKIL